MWRLYARLWNLVLHDLQRFGSLTTIWRHLSEAWDTDDRPQGTYSFLIFIPSTVTLFGAKMSNFASEPIDIDVTDAFTASKRLQWTLPPRSAMPKTTDPEMIGWEFRDNLKTYVVEEKHVNKRGNTSWIWRHGFQCYRRGSLFPHPQKLDWLCALC
jgi:hypothetical protein